MSNIIQQLEAEQRATGIPSFAAGDTIIVKVKVKEGSRERLQAFEGVVIARKDRSAFTVRKISHGVGVERVFQTDSKQIESITVKRHGRVRRAKLYYMRERSGKRACIAEDLRKRGVTEELRAETSTAQPVVEETAPAEAEAQVVVEEAKATEQPKKKKAAEKKSEAKAEKAPKAKDKGEKDEG